MAASSFYSDVLDINGYTPKGDKGWPSLKLIFDNLRCYPILAIFGVAMRFLHASPDWSATIAFWFMLPIFLLLFIATLVQSAVLFAVLTIGIIFAHLPLNAAEVIAQREMAFRVLLSVFLIMFVPLGFISAFRLLGAIAKFLGG